jgi:hypothetical protein
MFRNSKQVGKVAKARGLARAAVIAGVIVAGAGTGYLVSTSLGSEGGNPTYCDFSYSGPAISCGNVIKFDPLTATAYVCVPCPPRLPPVTPVVLPITLTRCAPVQTPRLTCLVPMLVQIAARASHRQLTSRSWAARVVSAARKEEKHGN